MGDAGLRKKLLAASWLADWLLHGMNGTISMNRGNLSDDWRLLAVPRTCERWTRSKQATPLRSSLQRCNLMQQQ